MAARSNCLDTRSSATAHGGAASRGSTQGNAVEVHRSLPGRSRSPPKVHLMAATTACIRYYTTRTHPAGGLGRSIRGAGWPRSAFLMTRSDFQKNPSSEQTPNLAWNTARKVYTCTGDFEDLGPIFWTKCACSAKIVIKKALP